MVTAGVPQQVTTLLQTDSREQDKHEGIGHLLSINENENIYLVLKERFEMATSRGVPATCLCHRQPASSPHCHHHAVRPRGRGSSRGNANVFPHGTAAL